MEVFLVRKLSRSKNNMMKRYVRSIQNNISVPHHFIVQREDKILVDYGSDKMKKLMIKNSIKPK